jgi:hypothetical protein
MPSNFDTLIDELNRAEAKRNQGEGFAKAHLNENPLLRVNASLRTLQRTLDAAMKAVPVSRPKAPTAQEQREVLAKSLTALNLKIGEAAETGTITATEAAMLEARLHGIVQQAAPHFVAVRR